MYLHYTIQEYTLFAKYSATTSSNTIFRVTLHLLLPRCASLHPEGLSLPRWCGQTQGPREEHTDGQEEGVEAHTPSNRNLGEEPDDNRSGANCEKDKKGH